MTILCCANYSVNVQMFRNYLLEDTCVLISIAVFENEYVALFLARYTVCLKMDSYSVSTYLFLLLFYNRASKLQILTTFYTKCKTKIYVCIFAQNRHFLILWFIFIYSSNRNSLFQRTRLIIPLDFRSNLYL